MCTITLLDSSDQFGHVTQNNAVLFFNCFRFVNGELLHQMRADRDRAVMNNTFIQCVLLRWLFLP